MSSIERDRDVGAMSDAVSFSMYSASPSFYGNDLRALARPKDTALSRYPEPAQLRFGPAP